MAINWIEKIKRAEEEEKKKKNKESSVATVKAPKMRTVTLPTASEESESKSVLEIRAQRQKMQKDIEKRRAKSEAQKQERARKEQEAYDNVKKLESDYKTTYKWLLGQSNKNTEEYSARLKEMNEKSDAYKEALKKYNEDYAQEAKARLSKSNKESFENVVETGEKVLATGVDAIVNPVQGFLNIPEGLADMATHAIAQAYDNAGNAEEAERLRKNAQVNVTQDKWLGKTHNYLDKKSYMPEVGDEILQGVGYSATLAGLNLMPGAGKAISDATLVASSMGSSLNEAYSNPDVNDVKAWTKAGLSAGLELGVEKLFGVLGYGGSSIDDMLLKSTDNIKNGLAKAIADTGITMTGEGVEEMLSYAGNYLIDHGLDLIDDSSKLGQEWDNQEFWKNFFVGAMSAGIAQGPANIIKSSKKSNAQETLPSVQNNNGIEVLPTAKTEVKQEEKTELPTANSQPILKQSQVAEYVNEKNVASEVKNRMQSVVNKTNKIANSDVQLKFASLDGDKKAQTDGNTITVDISKASLEDVIHEITHNTETSKGYMAVSDYILTELDKRGELQGIKDEITSIYSPVYEQEGRTFTEQELESEIVAKYTEQFASDENFINKITQEDRNFAQKIYDWIKEKVSYYRTVKNMTDEQRAQYDELRKAEKLWLNALKNSENTNGNTLATTKYNNRQNYSIDKNNFLQKNHTSGKITMEGEVNNGKEWKQNNILPVLGRGYSSKSNSQRNEKGRIVKNYTKNISQEEIDRYNNEASQDVKDTIRLYSKDSHTKAELVPITEKAGVLYQYKKRLKEIYNIDLVGYKCNGGMPAFIHSDNPSKVFVRTNSTDIQKLRAVLAHEVGHLFEVNNPQLAREVKNIIRNELYDYNGNLNERGLAETAVYGDDVARVYRADSGLYLEERFADQFSFYDDILDMNVLEIIKQKNVPAYKKITQIVEKVFNDVKDFFVEHGILKADDLYLSKKRKLYTSAIRKSTQDRINRKLAPYVNASKISGKIINTADKGRSKYSLSDNKGRELTKEQQEFFKNSKVRDENGNLLAVYHGTDSQFNEYTNIKTEPGYWFTENTEYASEHGKNIKEQYLNLTNPIDDVDKMWDIGKDYFGNNVEEKQILSNEFKEHLKSLGYDGMVWEHSGSNTYIAFGSNQIKNVDNTNPTENPDIRYSLDEEQGKERKHYKSIATSGMVGEQGKKIARNLLEKDRYIPTSNAKQMEHADNVVKNAGIESSLESFRNKIKTEQRLTPNDLALGERLIQEYSRSGDIETLNNLIQDVAIIGTELGQTVQALSLIHKMSPEGQLMTLQKSINRLNMNERTNIKLTNEQTQKIIKAKGEQELQEAMAEVSKEIAEQIPLKATDKLRSWRYLSMLGNPRTHIRNILSNVAMKGTKAIKDAVAGTIEDVIKPTERTRTLKRVSKETKAFAKQDANERIEMIANGGKYDVNTAIKQSKKQFNNKVLNALAEFNSNALETEDKIFLKSAYTQALSKYMTANNLTAKYLQSGTKEANIALTKARDFATLEAQVATFRQFSWLASKISQIENKNSFNKVVVGGLLPFKKTPINIAKTGIDYSPVGLVKGLTYDMVQLKKGNINANKFIDNISKGLTGTSISLIGYFLAQAGILKASGDDDDRAEDYDTSIGNQQYAINIGDKSFTIDWLSPTAMPLFVGAEFYNATSDQNEINLNALTTATTKTLNPLTEMSMLQSFASTLSSFNTEGSAGKLGDMGANMIESYIGQYFPTIVGQIARIVDDTERDTYYTDKTGAEARVQRFVNKQVAKIPFLSKTLEPRVDVWGEEVKRDNNIALRAINQLLNPSYVKTVQTSTADKEVQRLYKASEDSSVLPKAPGSTFNINAIEYKLTPEEYTAFKKSFGKYNKNVLNNIATKKEYTSLTDTEKLKTIDALYEDSRNKAIQSYANNNKIKYDGTDDVDTLISKKNLSLANAYIYRGNVTGIQSDKDNSGETIDGSKSGNKAKYIMAMNTSKEQKNLLLTLTTSSKVKPTVDDLNIIGEKNYSTYYSISNAQSREKYVDLASTGMNSSALNKYIENIGSIEGKKDSNGKTISGTLKSAKANYINSLSISRNEKLLLFGKDYKLSASERQEVLKHVNSLSISSKQKLEILSQLKGVTIKNNKVYWD